MNVLEKIKHLQQDRGWTTYKLAYESGLTQSTLSNMFKRKTCPTIDTLKMICDAFGISLSEFFRENENEIHGSYEEIEIIKNYRRLTKSGKKAIKDVIAALCEKQSIN